MRELMLGPKRFSDIRADLPGIQRQHADPAAGGAGGGGAGRAPSSCRRPPPARSTRSPNGAISRSRSWARSAAGRRARRGHDPSQHFSARLADAVLPGDEPAGDHAGDRRHDRLPARPRKLSSLTMKDGAIGAARGEPGRRRSDLHRRARARSPPRSMAACRWRRWRREGALEIEGDRALAERFVTLFPLPPKAPVPA